MGERGPLPKKQMEAWLSGQGPRPSVNGKTAPAESVKVPRAPAKLGNHGRKLWRGLYPRLVEMDMLAESDLASFELLCHAYQVARDAYEQMSEDGAILKDGRGQARKHPAAQVARDYTTLYTQLAKEFGMTPSAAARLGLEAE